MLKLNIQNAQFCIKENKTVIIIAVNFKEENVHVCPQMESNQGTKTSYVTASGLTELSRTYYSTHLGGI